MRPLCELGGESGLTLMLGEGAETATIAGLLGESGQCERVGVLAPWAHRTGAAWQGLTVAQGPRAPIGARAADRGSNRIGLSLEGADSVAMEVLGAPDAHVGWKASERAPDGFDQGAPGELEAACEVLHPIRVAHARDREAERRADGTR